MPCYTQQKSVVQFGAQTDVNLLKLALERMGFSVRATQRGLSFSSFTRSGTFENGTLSISSREQEDTNAFKRAYSAEVVRAASKRFGWTVKQTEENKFQVTRRA